MGAKYKLVKICSVEEVEEKMEMGICFICDKPFTVEYQLLHHTNIQMIMKEDEEEIDLDGEGPTEQKQNEGHGFNSVEAYSFTTEESHKEQHEEVHSNAEDSLCVSICNSQTPTSTSIPTNMNMEKPTDSTHIFFDSLMSCDGDIEQSQVEDNTFTNPVLPLQVFDQMPMKRLNSTSMNQQHSTISSPKPLIVQLPKGILISHCNFSIGLSAFTQNHSSPSNLQHLSEVELKCFDPVE
jgi:hypothetical protein